MAKAAQTKPTESELEILQVLWQRGKCTVREVHEELATIKDSGYTTTLKLMQIMFEKALVKRDDSSKTHIYEAAINKEKTQSQMVGKMMKNLFDGSSGQLVLRALGTSRPSETEIMEIQKLLNSFK